MTKQSTLDYALWYAKIGWKVFPLHSIVNGKCSCGRDNCTSPGKHPLTANGAKDATITENQIRKWWAMWPNANVGVATGGGLIVLDEDPRHSGDVSIQNVEVPDTVQVLTGGGGNHYYFKTNGFSGNRTNIRPGLDVRGDGGFVVAPPSNHISGKRYEFELSSMPGEVPLADCPVWMAEDKQSKQQSVAPIGEVIAEGCRNATLTSLAGSMRKRGALQPEIYAALIVVNKRCVPQLDDEEIQKISESVAKYQATPLKNITKNGVFRAEPEEWPEPEPLTETSLLPVAKLPPDIIPGAFRPWLVDISKRMQCPIDFVAVGAMVAASIVVGAGCAIRPKALDDWAVIPNLWGGIIGRPSLKKSPALAEVLKPLSKLESDARDKFKEEIVYSEADKIALKACKDAITSAMLSQAKGKGTKTMDELKQELVDLGEPEEPIRRRYKTSDSTVEKLGELLNQNPRGVLVFRDELTGLLASWEQENHVTDRAFYLECWTGTQDYSTDRVVRGTIDIQSCCVSILGGIQPGKLLAYLMQAANNLQNDGMIQRFQLLVYPDEPKNWEYIDEKPNQVAREQAAKIFEKLANMDFLEVGAIEDEVRPYFRFNAEAQAVFVAWYTELEAKIRDEESPIMCEHFAKYRSLMPSIALLIHLIEGDSGPVTAEAAYMAAAWVDYLETHSRRIYGLLLKKSEKSANQLAKKILEKKLIDGFSVRDVYKKYSWYLLNTKELVEGACRELVELNWIAPELVPVTNRQATTIYRINEKIYRKA